MFFAAQDNRYGMELWVIRGIPGEFSWPMFLPAIVNSGGRNK